MLINGSFLDSFKLQCSTVTILNDYLRRTLCANIIIFRIDFFTVVPFRYNGFALFGRLVVHSVPSPRASVTTGTNGTRVSHEQHGAVVSEQL